MLHVHLAAIALAAGALATSGCGGSSKTTSTTTASTSAAPTTTEAGTTGPGKTLTRAQLITQGDLICTHLNKQLDSIAITTTRSYAQALPRAAAYEQAEAAELSKLIPPTSMANDWKQILVDTHTWAEGSAKVGEYAKANKLKEAAPLLLTTKKAHEQLAQIAKRDGFSVCSIV